MAPAPHWPALYPSIPPQDFPAHILWLPCAATPRFNIKTVVASPQSLHARTLQQQQPPRKAPDNSNGARLHLRHRVRGRAQEPVPRRQARARQCRLRRGQARDTPRGGRGRGRRQEVVDPRFQERRRVHRPVLARWLASRRLRLRPAGPGQGPGVPQVVQGGRADPRAVGDGRRAGHLHRAGVQRRAVVRGRRAAGRGGALLLRVPPRHPAAAHGVGGVEAVGGLLQPGLAVRGVGHAVVAHRRELLQLHRRPRLPRRQVLRPARPRRRDQGRRLHPRRRQARPAQAGRDQARAPRHARHAHLLLRGRTGQDAARRARPINSDARSHYQFWLCARVRGGRGLLHLHQQIGSYGLHGIDRLEEDGVCDFFRVACVNQMGNQRVLSFSSQCMYHVIYSLVL